MNSAFVNGRKGWFPAVGVVCAGLQVVSARAAPAPPPPARVQPVTDVYFGKTIVDNYRWMEAEPEPQFRAMVGGQSAYAHAVIDAIPGRDRLEQDISEDCIDRIPIAAKRGAARRSGGGLGISSTQ